ncbi:hypothetical protein JYK00_07930 [Thermosipho ferrireducens]|uniref:Uncharacterized protein n=1 Tax=Thermosipho ferrireducens TaxID=2571116 RepID=A0ABX7S8P5_9BACT|nr:hypothetical protein [Thermosipho ferrireducens]QTA37651.1 hypothetical protein JYK00_07930 [Thermosipho ferrireducens]
MLTVTAYSTLMFIANIVLGAVLVLGIVQQAKSTFGIASVTSMVYLIISLSFFASGGFTRFLTRLGFSISPFAYALLSIISIMLLKNFGSLKVREGMRFSIVASLLMILILIFDFFWVGNAAMISLFSIGWAYVIMLFVGYTHRNIK